MSEFRDIVNEIDKKEDIDQKLRPSVFDEFVGQPKIVENLKIFISAAKK